MNKLTSRQRKMVYVGGIVLLLIPIILLGLPAGQEENSGGVLSKLRDQYDLGESTLGNVDPSSAAMNLVLLGLRGPAASILQLEAKELQKTKNWGKLRAIVDTVTLLQPHYIKVWEFEGWNLAYNVSAAWDATEDRYYWVKEGIKFQQKGVDRNQKSADLVFHTARLVGWKIGQSDEWKFFRKYFIVDPDDVQFGGGPDPAINPRTRDNWLVSKDTYAEANRVEAIYGQRVQSRSLFRQYPARVQIEYASTLQKEGKFDEQTRLAWVKANDDWINDFGREDFFEARDGGKYRYVFESWFSNDPEVPDGETPEIISLAKENFPDLESEDALQAQQWLTEHHIKTVNYKYWRQLTQTEMDEEMVEAHRHIYRGKELYRQGRTSPRGENGEKPSEARVELELGMLKLDKIFKKYPELVDDALIEEAMSAVLYWLDIHELNEIEPPEKFSLYEVWTENQHLIAQVKDAISRERAVRR